MSIQRPDTPSPSQGEGKITKLTPAHPASNASNKPSETVTSFLNTHHNPSLADIAADRSTQEITGAIADGVELDPRFGAIRSELIAAWERSHPGQDILSAAGQNYNLGNPGNPDAPTLSTDTTRLFRERFPEDARGYDAKERVRVYATPREDPAYRSAQDAALEMTNRDPLYRQDPSRDTLRSAAIHADYVTWTEFAKKFPEKTSAYTAMGDPHLMLAQQRLEHSNKQGVTSLHQTPMQGAEQNSDQTQKNTPESSANILLEEAKRPYTIDDIRATQADMALFDAYSTKQGRTFTYFSNGFYDYLTTGSSLSHRGLYPENRQPPMPEQLTNPEAYDALILKFYTGWRENMINNRDEAASRRPDLMKRLGDPNRLPLPKSATELREIFEKYPELNEICGVSYQGDIQEARFKTPFVHFVGHRYSGYAYERPETQVRLYLHPPKEALPHIAQQFADQAIAQDVPFTFKLIDFSIAESNADTRLDRMIFYTDNQNAAKTLEILQGIQKTHPEWFANRELPPLTAEVIPGIGFAQDPSAIQDAKFADHGKTKTSFNGVRSRFLEQAWQGATIDILKTFPDQRLGNGQTLREVFGQKVAEQGITPDEARQLWANGLDGQNLNQQMRGKLQSAVSRTMIAVMPKISAESLKPYIDQRIAALAPSFEIDPENLARNAT
ncbi:MAG: hypothetical protein HYV40_01955 [Candidatus Levybacteria bacterium]|nr:hypothetical protein [Candidatus Levybacteria bacterium]